MRKLFVIGFGLVAVLSALVPVAVGTIRGELPGNAGRHRSRLVEGEQAVSD